MFGYLSRLSSGMKILQCYLIWYLYFGLKYFESDLELRRRSLGIALLVAQPTWSRNLRTYGTLLTIVTNH